MEKWVFLGRQWNKLSPLKRLALELSEKKRCVWVSDLSACQFMIHLIKYFTQVMLNRRLSWGDDSIGNMVTFNTTRFVLRYWLKKSFSDCNNKTVVITDNPAYQSIIGYLGAGFFMGLCPA